MDESTRQRMISRLEDVIERLKRDEATQFGAIGVIVAQSGQVYGWHSFCTDDAFQLDHFMRMQLAKLLGGVQSDSSDETARN